MKVTSWETVEVEVETNIDIEDLASEIIQDREKSQRAMNSAINNFYNFMKVMPDEIIAMSSEKQVELITDFLDKTSDRFKSFSQSTNKGE